jgi:tetratricopeptide (TPR) repeat protein
MSMPARLRATSLAALLAATPAGAAILATGVASVPAAPERVIADSINCVAAVLAYRTTDAENICTRVITAMPDEALGYKFRGLAHLLEHRFEQAEPDFARAVKIAPDDAENQAGLAQSLSGQGRFAAAIPYFDAALELAPDDIRFLAARCWARAGLGGEEILDKALLDCNRAADLAPDYPTARLNRGLVRLKQQNWRAAIEDYTRALDTGGDLPSALFGRGFAWLQLKDEAQASADIRAARKSDPGIDALFIRVGVLPASCREPQGECPLPPALRPSSPEQPMVMVSFSPNRRLGYSDEMGISVRSIALGRMDVMLMRTAELLETGIPASITDEDATPLGAVQHLARLQAELRRQQTLACSAGLISGKPCQAPDFHPASGLADDPLALRWEIEHTMNALHPFWLAVCQAKKGSCIIE